MFCPVTQLVMYHSVMLLVLLMFLHVPLSFSLSFVGFSGALPGKVWAVLTFCQGLLLMLEDACENRSCTITSSVSPVAPALRYEQR